VSAFAVFVVPRYTVTMNGITPYTFRKVTLDDLPLLSAWQAAPHVAEWWDGEEPYTAEDLADPRVARWIVSHADRPFAYMQDYTVHGWEDHHFGFLPEGARGIDQFIGVPEMLGAGHGAGFIDQRMRALYTAGAPMIATDPHPDNARAVAVYQKLGFTVSGPPQKTQWGLILPLIARR